MSGVVGREYIIWMGWGGILVWVIVGYWGRMCSSWWVGWMLIIYMGYDECWLVVVKY